LLNKIKVFVIIIIIVNLVCCEKKRKTKKIETGKVEKTWSLPLFDNKGEVLALINNNKIYKSQVVNLQKSQNLTFNQALNKTIDNELVFQESLKSHKDEISELYKSMAVYELFEVEFEKKNSPAQMSDKELQHIYNEIQSKNFTKRFKNNKFSFDHMEWRKSLQILIKKKHLKNKDVSASVRSMFRLVKQYYEVEKENHMLKEKHIRLFFQNLGFIFRNAYYDIRFEFGAPELSLIIEENYYRFGQHYDMNFIQELFKISEKFETSRIFQTRFGIHFVFLEYIVPEIHQKFAEAKEELKKKLTISFQSFKFNEWSNKIKKKYTYKIFKENVKYLFPEKKKIQ
jgi:hypothetical protein